MFPERIICLSGESADICNRLGAADRVVAVSAFAPRSMRAGRPVVGGFSTLKMEDLLPIEPDQSHEFSGATAHRCLGYAQLVGDRVVAQSADRSQPEHD
jgi:ABC-type hemin transport system substrate-binding protein